MKKKITLFMLAVLGMAIQGVAQTKTPVSYIYEHAGYFKNGLAMVSKDDVNYFFINKEGEAVTSPLYSWYYSEWSEGLKAVKRNGKYGYIDSTGKEVIPCTLAYEDVEAFHDGLAKVVLPDDRTGYIDRTGRRVIPCSYASDSRDFSEGLAAVRQGWDYYFIDKTGRKVFNKSFVYADSFSEELAAVTIGVMTGNRRQIKYAYINKSGNVVLTIATTTEDISCDSFHEGLARIKKNGKYGYINKRGQLVIPYTYKRAGDFKDGVANVTKANGEDIYINKSGRQVNKPSNLSGIITVKENRTTYYFTDKNGNRLFGEVFDDAGDFSEGFACVKKNGKWGYINEQGNGLLMEPQNVSTEEVFNRAMEMLNSDDAKQVKKGIEKMKSLSNSGYAPATYAVAYTYGWLSDEESVRRKRLLGIEIFEEGSSKYLPKSYVWSNLAIKSFSTILTIDAPEWCGAKATAAYHLASYFIIPNNIIQPNIEKGRQYLLQAKEWAEAAKDNDLLELIRQGLANIEN